MLNVPKQYWTVIKGSHVSWKSGGIGSNERHYHIWKGAKEKLIADISKLGHNCIIISNSLSMSRNQMMEKFSENLSFPVPVESTYGLHYSAVVGL